LRLSLRHVPDPIFVRPLPSLAGRVHRRKGQTGRLRHPFSGDRLGSRDERTAVAAILGNCNRQETKRKVPLCTMPLRDPTAHQARADNDACAYPRPAPGLTDATETRPCRADGFTLGMRRPFSRAATARERHSAQLWQSTTMNMTGGFHRIGSDVARRTQVDHRLLFPVTMRVRPSSLRPAALTASGAQACSGGPGRSMPTPA